MKRCETPLHGGGCRTLGVEAMTDYEIKEPGVYRVTADVSMERIGDIPDPPPRHDRLFVRSIP